MLIRPRFRLRTLFVFVNFVRRRRLDVVEFNVRSRAQKYLQRINSDVANPGLFTPHVLGEYADLPLIWRVFRAKSVDAINLSRERWSDSEIKRVEAMFPEADIFIADHHSYSGTPDRPAGRLKPETP